MGDMSAAPHEGLLRLCTAILTDKKKFHFGGLPKKLTVQP